MVLYFFQSISILLIILSICNFLTSNFKVENNTKYIFSVLIIICSCFLLLKIIKFLNLNSNLILDYIFVFKYLFFILLTFSLLNFILNKYKINNLDLWFIGTYLAVSILCYDRYFLDEDEFTYWGLRVKDFYYYVDTESFKINKYHEPLLTSWQLFFISYAEFKENILIFANNVILIAGFFYIADNSFKKFKVYTKLFPVYFFLFYLLTNNLSFGFVSIYADPILAILSSCIIKLIIENSYDQKRIVLLILLIFCVYFVHRLGIIFLIILLPYILLKNYRFLFFDNKKKLFISLIIIIVATGFLFFKKLTYSQTLFNLFDRLDLINEIVYNFILNIKKISLVNIYYSSFGVSLNKIIEIIIHKKDIINNLSLNIFFWTMLIVFLSFLSKKKDIFLYFIISLIFYSLVIYIEKIYFQRLSYLVFGRYMSILLLSYILYFILKNKNIYLLYFLLIFNLSITPLKSLGFFVPDNIYYSYKKNKNYYENRNQIKLLSKKYFSCKNIFAIYDKNNFPKYLNGHYSLVLNIFNYEMFFSKIRFQDIDELRQMRNTDFFNFFDCVFTINAEINDLRKYNFRTINPMIISL